jgi:hypothetical protein
MAQALLPYPKLTWFTSLLWLIVADLQRKLERWHKKVEMVWVLFPLHFIFVENNSSNSLIN